MKNVIVQDKINNVVPVEKLEKNTNLVKQDEEQKKISGTYFDELATEIVHRSAFALPTSTKDRTPKEEWGRNELIMKQALVELEPQNALEGMLCSQIVALHVVGIRFLGVAQKQDLRCHQDPDLNNAIKLLRLQHETIECLARLRRGGQQLFTIQHVNVNDGGRAIVNGQLMSAEGEGKQKTAEVPHGHYTDM